MVNNKPLRIKQIMLLPEHIMEIYKNEDDNVWEDCVRYGSFLFLGIKDNSDEKFYYPEDDDDIEIFESCNDGYIDVADFKYHCFIRAYKCPECGNRMTIKPFKDDAKMITYVCQVDGYAFNVGR